MSVPPLLVGASVPVALQAIGDVASSLTDAFHGWLTPEEASASAVPVESGENQQTIYEQIESLAAEFRGWLKRNGVEGPFELAMNVSADGHEAVDVQGPDSRRIRSLLERFPEATEKLRRFAASMHSLHAYLQPDSVQLQVTDLSANVTL